MKSSVSRLLVMLSVMPASLYSQCLIKTDNYRLVCADEVRYADSIASGTRLYISSKNAYVSSPRSIFNLVEGYGQYFFKVTNSANSQKIAVGRKWVTRIDSTGAGKALIYIRDINVTFTTTESYTAVVDSAISCFQRAVSSGLSTLSDGDYGDVVVSGGGLVMTVDKPDLGLHNLADGDFSVVADSTTLSLTNTRQITLQTKNIDGWISRYLQTNNSLTLRTNSTSKTSRIFVDSTGANFQFVNGSNNASLRIGDSVAVRFNSSGSVGQVLTVTSIDGDGRLVINPKTGGTGTANCEQTLTKTSHGFRKWTPIYWNGSTWARPTYDSIIPSYIVVDSTSTNTFKVANCGNYSSSLTSGVYYYTGTSPGYTLTQPEIKVPLFEVVQSRLILQPLIGFQLAGSGGTADGNGIYSGSDSLSQENTYAAMAADGSQTLGIGYFPSFPDLNYNEEEKGLYISPDYWNEISLLYNSPSQNNVIGHTATASFMYNQKGNRFGGFGANLGSAKIEGQGSTSTDKYWSLNIDSTKFRIIRNISGVNRTYELLPPSQYPSTTSNTTNILKWTGNGSSAVPSFDKYIGYAGTYDSLYGYAQIPQKGWVDDDLTFGFYRRWPGGNSNSSQFYSYRDGNYPLYTEISDYEENGNYYGRLVFQKTTTTPILASLSVLDFLTNSKYNEVRIDTFGVSFRGEKTVGGNWQYRFPQITPSSSSGAISQVIWTAGVPSFLRSQHRVVTGTTDGSGDLTVTFAAAMPDATYSLIATVEGTTSYTISVHTKATGTCKVRFFNPATGAAVTATSVTISYESKDY